jgi:hypothetical protein
MQANPAASYTVIVRGLTKAAEALNRRGRPDVRVAITVDTSKFSFEQLDTLFSKIRTLGEVRDVR